MKATKQYSPVVLFIMLYKVVLSFESVDGILEFNYSNESDTDQYCHKGHYKPVNVRLALHHPVFLLFFLGGGGGDAGGRGVGGGRSNQCTCLTVTD